ncbi:MAG TPA: histidine kinase [Longimicrobium sp.]|nr:histidine kinase [Longimicrobium sp.]
MDVVQTAAPRRGWWRWWVIAAVWWTIEGLTDVTGYVRMVQAGGGTVQWNQVLREVMASAWLWIPFTLLALWVADRWPLERDSWRRRLAIHAAASVGVCVARAVLVVVLNPWVGWYRQLPGFGEVLVTSFINNLLLYWMLVGVGHALVYARRYRERDEQLARAQLHALRMQLHPHFLFNALNTVNSYVRADPDTAERMIARLGQLLRHALSGGAGQEVPLEEELQMARAYLEIEQARFEDRLRVRWNVDPATHAARVPSLILQPLVENAVRHGIAPRAAEGTIEIAAERRNGTLHLSVRDDGVGFSEDAAAGEGVGLANTRARLRQLYGSRQSLELLRGPHGGACVEVSLPFRVEPG